jgi:pullulanase/glycogen debranching enzyme
VDFDFSNLHWEVLQLANDQVIKFTDLLAAINQQHPVLTSKQLLIILKKLKAMHIIYCNRDFDNVITVIDIDELLIC